jgi:hypothetical protein
MTAIIILNRLRHFHGGGAVAAVLLIDARFPIGNAVRPVWG